MWSNFLYPYLPSVCLLWKTVCTETLPIFKLSCLFSVELSEFLVYFFFFNAHTHSRRKFPGQGLNPSGSCNLRCSCSNAGSNHCSRPGTKPTPLQQPEWLQLDSYLTHCATAGTPSLYTFDESPLLEVFYQYPLPA